MQESLLQLKKWNITEIASYGTLAAFAKVLGYKQSLKLLLATLEEEKKCDEHLTQIKTPI